MNGWVISAFRERAGSIVLSGLLFGALSVGLSVFLSPKYVVRTDYLVSQEDAATKDYYALSRSAEYMGKVLTEVAGSERFIAAVVDTGKVGEDFLPADKRTRLKEWNKMVMIEKEFDLGIISATVSSDNLREAQKISQAIEQVFTEKNGMFLGMGDRNVPVSVLSGPISERNPSPLKLLISVVGGFLFGCMLALLSHFMKTEAFRRDGAIYPDSLE